MNYLSFVRLKDVSTLYFSNPSFNPPGPFNPRIFNRELFNPRLFNHEFLNYGVEKFMVEKAGVEMSFKPYRKMTFQPSTFQPQTFQLDGSKIHGWKVQGWKIHGWQVWGWKVRGWDVIQPFVSVESPTNNIIRSERQQRLSFYDKLSTCGGILGLCNGMSALTIAECLLLLCSLFYAFLRIVGKRLNFICITEKSDATNSSALENDNDESDEDLWLQLVELHVRSFL